MKKKSPIDWIAYILVIVGGLNWGLVGIAKFNLVEKILGSGTMLSSIVYDLVGLAAIYMIVRCWTCSKSCDSKR